MRWVLMGKYKMEEWKEIDSLPTNDPDLENNKRFLMDEHKIALGSATLLKWELK